MNRVSRLTDRGLTIVTLAVTLPIVLILAIAAIDLFLYFRACSVVQRAAAEAGTQMAVALPGDRDDYASGTYPNSLSEVEDKELIETDRNSVIYHERSDGSGTDTIKMPFLLSTSENGPDAGTGNPGVQYLPFVTVYTCLEPQNETAHTMANCSSPSRAGFLTYQIPTTLDFDGDSKEDITFYYGNGDETGQDWHIILSSTGALFRQNLRFELGMTSTASPRRIVLPAPGDYDGDGKTDPAILRGDSNPIVLRVRFSSKRYKEYTYNLSSNLGASTLRIPVVGRYNTTGASPMDRDRLAVILLETTYAGTAMDLDFLNTLIWPAFDTSGADPTIVDTSTKYSNWSHKPAPGENWRPAFGDYDGDGSVDIGWLTWPGGYLTAHVGGKGLGTSSATTAKDSFMIPWALHYPRNNAALGLYVIERNSHRVLLIKKGDDDLLLGNGDNEDVKIIVGSASTPSDQTFDADPVHRGFDDSYDTTCPNCYAGGGFSGDGSTASSAEVKQPTAVASLGGLSDPLFIADYGNRRVRMIASDGDGIDGSAGEVISTLAGGGKKTGDTFNCPNINASPPAYCPADCTGSGSPPALDKSCPWTCYVSSSSMHPKCAMVRPLSIDVIKDSNLDTGAFEPAVVVGDEKHVVFIIYANDGVWGNADDTMEILAGEYGSALNSAPSGNAIGSSKMGFPTALSVRVGRLAAGVFEPAEIVVVTRSNTDSGAGGTLGGVFQILPGADAPYGDFRAGTRNETISSSAGGTWAATTARPQIFAAGNTINHRNPTALAISTFENAVSANGYADSQAGWFVSGWINGAGAGTPYENSLLQIYGRGQFAVANRTSRWFTNPHLLSWGFRAPGDEAASTMRFNWNDARPLGTLPIEASAGLALSPDNRYLYLSQTRRGEINVVYLDQDGDGKPDYGGSTSADCYATPDCLGYEVIAAGSANTDGDDHSNSIDHVGAGSKDTFQFNVAANGTARAMEVYQDARLWARGVNGAAVNTGLMETWDGAGQATVNRLEYVLDRFSAVQSVSGGSAVIPPVESGPFHVLNNNTIAAPNARGSMHTDPVWSGGVSRPTQIHGTTSKPRLSPIILGSRTPLSTQIKDESGYVECANWQLVEDQTIMTLPIDNTGYLFADPSTYCARVLATNVYTNVAHTVGTRRVHLSRWTGQTNPDIGAGCTSTPCLNQVGFLDRDGTGGRNPVVYETDRVTTANKFPLILRIGNIASCTTYGGQYAQTALYNKSGTLDTFFTGFSLGANDWVMNCNQDPFYTSDDVNILTIMADYHAEVSNKRLVNTVDTVAVAGNRTAQGGPIAQTAYSILRDSLKVTVENSVASPHHAQVSFTTHNEGGYSTEEAVVKYVYPWSAVMQRFTGTASTVIERGNKRVSHGLGRSL